MCKKLLQGVPYYTYVQDGKVQWTSCANDDGSGYIIQLSQVGSAVTYGPYEFQVVRVAQSDEQTQIDANKTIRAWTLNLAMARGYDNVVQIPVPDDDHYFAAKHEMIDEMEWFYKKRLQNVSEYRKLIYTIQFSTCGVTYGPFAYQEV